MNEREKYFRLTKKDDVHILSNRIPFKWNELLVWSSASFFLMLMLVFTSMGCNTNRNDVVNLIYENGNEKITVKFETGQDFLVYDQPTKTDFILENIDPITISVMGPGIKVLGTRGENKMRTEIKVPSNYLEKDTLIIKIRYGENYGKACEFQIPVKRKK